MYSYLTPFTLSSLLFWRLLVMVFRAFLIAFISFSYRLYLSLWCSVLLCID